jgi:cytochrome P450
MNDLSATQSLTDPEIMQNPFPFYQWAHANSPVVEIPGAGFRMVMGFAMCSEAANRVDDFSNNFSAALAGARAEDPQVTAILEQGWPQMNTLLTADPPVHTRFRKLVNLAFSMPRVNALEAGIRQKIVGLIEGFIDKGECEFVEEFCVPLPVQVICEQLGFDRSWHGDVKRWSDAFTDRLGHMISLEREMECAREIVEFQKALKIKIDERRKAPTDDLLSAVVNATQEGEESLTDAEIMSIAQQLMVAGNETTTHAIAGAVVHFANNPDQVAKLRADPALIPNAVEEVLRLDTPTAGMWRVVMNDCEVGGHAFKEGQMVILRYAAANRDPAQYPDPDQFDVERKNARTHLAFGKGIHMCVGNMLSRKEMTVAFQEILNRMDDIRLVEGTKLEVAPNMMLRGYIAVPITFRKRV